MLGENVPGFQIRRQKNVWIACDIRVDALGLCRLLTDRVVKRQWAIQKGFSDLSALGHFAKSSGIDGGWHFRGHRFNRGKDGDLRSFQTQRDGEVDGVLADIYLVLQRGRNIDRPVGNDQHLVIGRNIHDEYVTDTARGAQPSVTGDDCTHQFIGVQAALHE